MIQNWIKIAFRSYRKNLLFTMINILGLTIGMVGVILVSLYWNDELAYNQWNPNKDEVYAVSHEFNRSGELTYQLISTVPEGPAIVENFQEVEDMLVTSSYQKSDLIQQGNIAVYKDKILTASPNFFEFFPFDFIEGHSHNAIENLQSAAISEDLKKELFGDEKALNKEITIGNKEYTVRGVYRLTDKSSLAPNAVTNIDWEGLIKKYGENEEIYMSSLFLRIKPGTDIENLAERIYKQIVVKNSIVPFAKKQNLTIEEYCERNGSLKIVLDRLSDLRLYGKSQVGAGIVKGDLKLLKILTGLSILILIISGFNYINLTLASSLKRAKEVGIRKTLGGTRSDLIFQFTFESAILCVFSFIIALAAAELSLPLFNEFVKKELKLSEFDFFGELVIILFFIVLFAGGLPAVYLSKFKSVKVLKGDFSRSRSGLWIQNFMLGLQYVISGFFLISGVIMFLQVKHILKKDLGFNADQLVAVDLVGGDWKDNYNKYLLVKSEFTKINGVEAITTGFQIPQMYAYGGGPAKLIENDHSIQMAILGAMDYNFPEVFGLKIIEGRNISPDYASDTITNVLVNETFVKQMNMTHPIGKEFYYNPPEKNLTIVGVVKDYLVDGFQRKVEPTVYHHFNEIPFTKNMIGSIVFKINPNSMQTALNEIEKRWKKEIIPGGYPFRYKFVSDEFAKSYSEFLIQQRLFSIMTFISVFIALLGLFGLISFSVEQNMKEISIRKVLGATSGNLTLRLGKKYLIIASVSFLVSIPVTYYLMQKWLEDFAYRIDIPIWPFVFALILLLVLMLLIIGIRASYAMKASPVKYLKYE